MIEVAPRLHGKDAPLVGDEPMVEEFRTPRGKAAYMAVRPGTADHNNVFACLTGDEYTLSTLELGDGVALDIGAHIGGVAVALALDNPGARVIAVEALSVNVELLAGNVERNHLSDRVTSLHAVAAKPGVKSAMVEWNFGGGESNDHHRFIANVRGNGHNNVGAHADPSPNAEKVAAVSLDALVKQAGGKVAFMKIDCEGCEYQLLASPAVKDVAEIRGEFHAGYERIVDLLGDTHEVRQTAGTESFGSFAALRR